MGKDTHRTPLERTLGRLLERRTEAEGHRILLEAAQSLTGARAAALWARGARGWTALQALGEAEWLPEERRLRALLEDGGITPGLRAGEVLLAPAGLAVAIALAGAPEDEGLDELEALLLVHASTLDPQRLEAAPLPRREDSGPRPE